MSHKTSILLILATLVLGSCAGSNNNPDQFTFDLMNGELKDGDTFGAFEVGSDLLRSYPSIDAAKKARKMIVRQDNYKRSIRMGIDNRISSAKTFSGYKNVFSLIHAARESKLITESEAKQLQARAGDKLVYYVKTKKQSLPQDVDYGFIPKSFQKEVEDYREKAIEKRIVNDQEWLENNIRRALAFAQNNPEQNKIKRALKSALPGKTVDWDTLQNIKQIFPDYAQSVEANSITDLALVGEKDRDQLIIHKLESNLKERTETLKLVRNKSKADVILDVSALQWNAGNKGQQKETIRYERHQVNLGAAIFSMPDQSVYAYDVITTGKYLRFAVRLVARKAGSVIAEKIIDDTVSASSTECQNARIVNAFGGEKTVDFVANDDMRARCSGQSGTPSISELEERAIDMISAKVQQIEELGDNKSIKLPSFEVTEPL